MGAFCVKCGNTGITNDGKRCDCQAAEGMLKIPVSLDIPEQYRGVVYDKSFLPGWCQNSLGTFCESVLREIDTMKRIYKNIFIIAPPNTGKTVFAYSLYGMLYASNVPFPPLMDLYEAKRIMSSIVMNESDEERFELLKKSKTAIIRVPADLTGNFIRQIQSIIDFRCDNGGNTIFIYSGLMTDIERADKDNRLGYISGDGSYHTVLIKEWRKYEN